MKIFRDIVFILIGRVFALFFFLAIFLKEKMSVPVQDSDRTGLVTEEPKVPEIVQSDDVYLVKYDSIAHCFGKSQEYSLLMQYKALIRRPFMDFGCGDGSFSSLIFQSIDYGVDSNPEALERAEKYHVYGKLLPDTSSLMSGSLQSVFSSSVLEHVKGLETVLFEISRVLAPGGTLIFSVPVKELKEYFIRYFGRNFETKTNQLYRHYNLLDIAQWKDLLERNGLRVLEVRYYQPDWATFLSIIFLLFNRKICKIFFKDTGKAINRLRPFLTKITKDSISGRQSGSTALIMAKKI